MSSLDAISVNVEAETGNVRPLLHEIRHALKRLANVEDGTVIELVEDTGISGWLDLDPARRELFWVDGSRATRPDRAIHRFGVDAREHDLLAERRVAQGGIAYDEEYVYWTELGSIERVAR